MTVAERLTLLLTAMSVIGVPTLALVWRASRRWTRIEDALEKLADAAEKAGKENADAHRELGGRVSQLERDQLDYYRRARDRARSKRARPPGRQQGHAPGPP